MTGETILFRRGNVAAKQIEHILIQSPVHVLTKRLNENPVADRNYVSHFSLCWRETK